MKVGDRVMLTHPDRISKKHSAAKPDSDGKHIVGTIYYDDGDQCASLHVKWDNCDDGLYDEDELSIYEEALDIVEEPLLSDLL